MHYLAMKIKGLTVLLTLWVLLASSVTSGWADSTPTPSPSYDYQMLMLQYKQDLIQHQILIQKREQARSQINRIFIGAVDTANRDARLAMKSAKSSSAKNDVIVKLKNAIAVASDERDTAIAALGSIPTPPTKPVKRVEIPTLSKVKPQKSSSRTTGKPKN
jgi:hypothetical protein